ncbi:E3 ubiquitin-protein ligase Topors isoform X2 [Anolis carolinensis]
MASSNEEVNSSGNSFSYLTGTGNENIAIASDGPSDSRCPICLEKIQNVAFLNPCFHRFCFACILEWSDRKAECPLCKQHFNSFFHNIKTDTDFEEYIVPSENVCYGNCEERSRTAERHEFPEDNGILNEVHSGHHSQGSRLRTLDELMGHLGIRRTPYAGGLSLGQIQEHVTIKFRRALYQSGVRVRNVQSRGFYRDISADFFHRNPAHLNRLVPWLKRELRVLCGAHPSLINNIQHIILNNITIYDLDSQAFSEIIQPYLLHLTNHFLHEFINFARSPFNIRAYDWRASYDFPFPTDDDESQSYSSFTTSSSEEEEEEEGEEEEEEEWESEDSEENAEESVSSNEEGTWDDEMQRSASSDSDHTLDEIFLPFGSSDGELLRSDDNIHAFFQAEVQLGTNHRHSTLHKCGLDEPEENTSTPCKSIPKCFEASKHISIHFTDDEEEEGLMNEQEALRSHCFDNSTHSSTHSTTTSNVVHRSNSNQMLNNPQLPSHEQENDSMEKTLLHKQEAVSSKLIRHEGNEIFVVKILQPQTEDMLVIEHFEWKTSDRDDFAQLQWHGEETSNFMGPNSSTDIIPGGPATKYEGGCFSHIRRP